MNKMEVYDALRAVPKDALKEIQAGRLKGKSDINPMWRIKALTEQFGPCGIGWKYAITKQWLEPGGNGEISAFTNIDLFVKVNGEWSDAIPGTGGSSFVANERNGPFVSDECFKMSLTDAISVSCKALGCAADVYWNSDATKYSKPQNTAPKTQTTAPQSKPQTAPNPDGKIDQKAMAALHAKAKEINMAHETLSIHAQERYGVSSLTELTMKQGRELYAFIAKPLPKEGD